MKLLIGLLSLIILANISFAKIEDYLKGIDFERSFSPIEGKVIDINISLSQKKYNQMVEMSQLSLKDFYFVLHAHVPEETKFETKVSMNITVDDQVYSYEKVTFKVGGNFSRTNRKLGYNLKLKDATFFGRKNLRLRPEYFDLTHIRSKLAIDLINKWNIPTVQETYANLYVNGKFFGLYYFLDAIKPAWIQDVYNLPEDTDVKTLYDCSGQPLEFTPNAVKTNCVNEKDDYLNYTQPLHNMVDGIYNYTSVRQLEQQFNVENLRKIIIFEYLFNEYDNFIVSNNNYHLYQRSDGIWEMLPNDYDLLFLTFFDFLTRYIPFPIEKQSNLTNYISYSFEQWHSPRVRQPIIEILYYKDKPKFIRTLKEMLITGFNPDELFPRIDELAEFIAPYVERDITPDEDGKKPGQINEAATRYDFTMEMFHDALGYGDYNYNIGLKKFIQMKFDSVCEHFNLNKKIILKQAKIYRKKREIQVKMIDLKEEIEEKKKHLHELTGKELAKLQKLIEKLIKELNKLKLELLKIKLEI